MRSVLVLTVAAALALGAAPAGASTTLHYFEKQTSFTYTPAGGKPTHDAPQGPVKVGDRIEITGDMYVGDHRHHAKRPAGTDHTICVFDAKVMPHCDAQAAFGGSMLLLSSSGGDGDFDSPITGGTGRFAGAKGSVHTHPIGDNADITIRLKH